MQFARLGVSNTEQPTADQIELLQQWVTVVSEMVCGMRNSAGYVDQQIADVFEIWLADTLADESVAKHIDPGVIAVAVNRLPSVADRQKSRRRSVLTTWHRYRSEAHRYRSFVLDQGIGFAPPGLTPWLKDRRAEAIVMAMLDGIENPADNAWLESLHEYQLSPAVDIQQSPYGQAFRTLSAIKTVDLLGKYPGRYWGMDWERDIEDFKEQYHEE